MMNPPQRSRILIADHDQTFLDQLADRLLQMDMEVDFAENGKTAIKLVESESYDLIVTEIAMPLYNGLEILRKAKECNPRTPILITSFSATTDWAEQAIREGAHSYLLRPLKSMREFDYAIEDALKSKPTPQDNSFFNHVFSKANLDVPSTTHADIPMPDWELDQDISPSEADLEGSSMHPQNQFPSTQKQASSSNFGNQEVLPDSQISLSEGFMELNSQGQILRCDAAARNWLMLEANAPERPINSYIKALESESTPPNVEFQMNGRKVLILTDRIQDRKGSERIILRIKEAKEQRSAIPAPSFERSPHTMKQERARSESGVAFGGNLKKYDPDLIDQGWSPLMFVDQVKKTLKGELKRIKENNPLHIFEPPPEEADPEVLMTMSQRISDVSRGRSTSYR